MSFPGSDAASIEDVAHAKILALHNSILSYLPAKTARRTAPPAKSTKSRKEAEIAIETKTKTEARSSAKNWFTDIATKMMFVSGETAEPSPETTTLIEEITRQQVIEIVSAITLIANALRY